jgi:uncharacterized protein YqjF (DUF2071 family)
MSFLKNHPFAVAAHFNSSLVLTFAVPKEQLQQFLPPHLELDTFNDTWAFIAVAMVQTTGLRPKGFPKFMGHDFFLIGYRIFVRYTNKAGKRLRGLYIIKSETNKKMMQIMGNIFTHYNYSTTDIIQSANQNVRTIQSVQSDFEVTVEQTAAEIPLPASSPFANWQEARRFAGPLPFTFTYNPAENEMLIIEGVRENWVPQPVTVHNYHFGFLEQLQFQNHCLANAFEIKDIPYYWKKGKTETWK